MLGSLFFPGPGSQISCPLWLRLVFAASGLLAFDGVVFVPSSMTAPLQQAGWAKDAKQGMLWLLLSSYCCATRVALSPMLPQWPDQTQWKWPALDDFAALLFEPNLPMLATRTEARCHECFVYGQTANPMRVCPDSRSASAALGNDGPGWEAKDCMHPRRRTFLP